MDRSTLLWLLLGGGFLFWLSQQQQGAPGQYDVGARSEAQQLNDAIAWIRAHPGSAFEVAEGYYWANSPLGDRIKTWAMENGFWDTTPTPAPPASDILRERLAP